MRHRNQSRVLHVVPLPILATNVWPKRPHIMCACIIHPWNAIPAMRTNPAFTNWHLYIYYIQLRQWRTNFPNTYILLDALNLVFPKRINSMLILITILCVLVYNFKINVLIIGHFIRNKCDLKIITTMFNFVIYEYYKMCHENVSARGALIIASHTLHPFTLYPIYVVMHKLARIHKHKFRKYTHIIISFLFVNIRTNTIIASRSVVTHTHILARYQHNQLSWFALVELNRKSSIIYSPVERKKTLILRDNAHAVSNIKKDTRAYSIKSERERACESNTWPRDWGWQRAPFQPPTLVRSLLSHSKDAATHIAISCREPTEPGGRDDRENRFACALALSLSFTA